MLRIVWSDLLPSKPRSQGMSGIWALPECRITRHCFIGSSLQWFHLQLMSSKKCPAPPFLPLKFLNFFRARPSGLSPTIITIPLYLIIAADRWVETKPKLMDSLRPWAIGWLSYFITETKKQIFLFLKIDTELLPGHSFPLTLPPINDFVTFVV